MASESNDLEKGRKAAVMHRSFSGAITRVRGEGEAPDDTFRVEFKASSDEPVEMWSNHFEILDHSPESVRMGWLNSGNAPMLNGHRRSAQVGVIESARIEGNCIVVTALLSRSQKDLIQDIEDGIVRNVSVGYRIHNDQLEERDTDEHGYTTRAVWRTTDWEPNEVSFVSIPADKSVGLGRSADEESARARVMELEQRIEATPKEAEQAAPNSSQARTQPIRTMAENTIDKDKAKQQREDAVTAERVRAQGIATVAEKAREQGLGDFSVVASEHIESGKTVEDMQRHVLENMRKAPGVSSGELGLTEQEQKRYSVNNVIEGILQGDLQQRAAFELEVSAAHQDAVGRDGSRIAIPVDMLLRGYLPKGDRTRDVLTVTANGTGQNNSAASVVANELLPELFVESLREHSNILSYITMVGGLTGDVSIPREILNPAFTWLGEEEGQSEGDYTLDDFGLNFKSVGTYVGFSRKARKQSTPMVENLLMASVRKGLAIELAKQVISGNGTTQPLGILNAAGVGAVVSSGSLDRTKFRKLRKELGDANVDLDRARGVCGSNGEFQITDTLLDSGSGRFLGDVVEGSRLRTIIGNFDTTNVCPANAILYGDFTTYFMGMWGSVEIDRETSTNAKKGTTNIHFWQDVDGTPARGADFAAITDLSV